MKNSVKTKSWTFVIVLTIFIWPVGLYFLVQKLRYDKTASFKSSTSLYIAGGFMLIMAFTGLSTVMAGERTVDDVKVAMESSDTIMYLMLSACFLVGGFFVLKKAYTMSKHKNNYKKYIEIIVNQQETSIERISAELSITPDIVIRDLEEMIKIGIFENMQIDRSTSSIIFNNNQSTTIDIDSIVLGAKSVICPACGAKNIVDGTSVKCEYCGTILN